MEGIIINPVFLKSIKDSREVGNVSEHFGQIQTNGLSGTSQANLLSPNEAVVLQTYFQKKNTTKSLSYMSG